MKEQKWQKAGYWKTEALVILLLVLFGVWINRGIEIRGLYMDDLYLWSCYGEQSFREFVFPMGSSRFRFVCNLAAWLELGLIGNHMEWIVPINIFLNTAIAYTIYRMAHIFSRSSCVGALCGIGYLASHMAYYQISQLLGIMESLALWLAIVILFLLYLYLNDRGGKSTAPFLGACGVYFILCFVHERYMVLLPLFYLILFCRKSRDKRLWAAPAAVFALIQVIRALTIGTILPAGTGHTQVTETFSLGSALGYGLEQIAYLFGFNVGPDYLNGQNFTDLPIWTLFLISVADLILAVLTAAFVVKLIRERKSHKGQGMTGLLFVCFIGGCIACSSVTIRLEMRWIYVSYGAALLFLSWMYGVLTEDVMEKGAWSRGLFYLSLTALYVILMLPVEIHYRGQYPHLYYWADQQRYNSLAEETYGTYGEDLFGKTVYIVGDEIEMSDFTAETFFKTFDKERKAEGTSVVHIEDVREIGLIEEDMLVLKEEPENDRFRDVTQTVRELKCRGLYGYYEDGWIDERAKVQVMAGSTGEIGLDFYYPGEITGDQWITVYVDEEPQLYLELTDSFLSASLQEEPYETVTLEFETNFYVPDAQEQRGARKLAAILNMTAD